MAIHTFSISFTKEDWKSLVFVLLKAVQKRIEAIKSDNEFHLKLLDFLSAEITLSESD